jgi:hypothetical protein
MRESIQFELYENVYNQMQPVARVVHDIPGLLHVLDRTLQSNRLTLSEMTWLV